jgi:hypothetical protein
MIQKRSRRVRKTAAVLVLGVLPAVVCFLAISSVDLPWPSSRSLYQKIAAGDLVFLGRVTSIVLSPLERSDDNFIIKTKVLQVVKGEFSGRHFSFRIHSPALSGVEMDKEIWLAARRTPDGYLMVDPY